MKRKFLLVSVIPALACAAIAAPALAATQEAASENWAGYVDTTNDNAGYSAVSASWVQPAVTCSGDSAQTSDSAQSSDSAEASYSAYWVGLGGGDSSSDALEQIGTQADCSTTGTAKYYAWYELVPSAPVKLDLTINTGDTVWARTAVNGDKVSFYIKDRTTGQVWQKTLTMTAATPDTSTAEWVAEAPSECASGATSECEPLPLADFGTAKFAQAYATSGGKVGSISDSNWSATAIELEPSTSSVFGAGSGGYIGGGYGGGYSGDASTDYSSYSSGSEGAAPTATSDKGTTFSVKYGASLSQDTKSSGTGQALGESSSSYGYGGGYGGSSAYGNSYGDGYGSGYGESYGYGGSDGYGDSYGYGYYGNDYGSGY